MVRALGGVASHCAVYLWGYIPMGCIDMGAEDCGQCGRALRPVDVDIFSGDDHSWHSGEGYTLAFLFFSLCLLLLEKSLESGSLRSMLWFNVFLYLSILTEYSVAWFVAAAAVYAILRLRKQHATGRLLLLWTLGQLVALGLYLFSYKFHISRWQHKGAFEGI